jgi:hypothetical protein
MTVLVIYAAQWVGASMMRPSCEFNTASYWDVCERLVSGGVRVIRG